MVLNDLIYNLKALYWANDGSFSPSAPMKMYHGFMIDKINQANSSTLKRLVWRIIHFATGVFAYPILGFFAGLEMAITLLNWHLNGKAHNTENISMINRAILNVHEMPARGLSLSFKLNSDGSKSTSVLKSFREYDITCGPETTKGQFKAKKQQLTKEMKEIIQQFTNAYTKIYIQYSGSWQDGIKFTFLAADSLLPYCSNPLLPDYKKITYPNTDQVFQEAEVIE